MAAKPPALMPAAPKNRAPPAVIEDGVFRLQGFLPYEFSFIANRVSSLLAGMYQERFKAICERLARAGGAEREIFIVRGAGRRVHLHDAGERDPRGGPTPQSPDAKAQLQFGGLSTGHAQPNPQGAGVYQKVVPLAVKIEQELLKDIEPAELAQRRRVMASVVAECDDTPSA